MRGLCPFILVMALLDGALPPALADEPLSRDALIEDFTKQPEDRERFFTDPVMGPFRPQASPLQSLFRHRPTSGGGELTMGGDQEAKSARAESKADMDAA